MALGKLGAEEKGKQRLQDHESCMECTAPLKKAQGKEGPARTYGTWRRSAALLDFLSFRVLHKFKKPKAWYEDLRLPWRQECRDYLCVTQDIM